MLVKIITKNTYPKTIQKRITPIADPQHTIIENNMWHPITQLFFGFFDATGPRIPAIDIRAPTGITRKNSTRYV